MVPLSNNIQSLEVPLNSQILFKKLSFNKSNPSKARKIYNFSIYKNFECNIVGIKIKFIVYTKQ